MQRKVRVRSNLPADSPDVEARRFCSREARARFCIGLLALLLAGCGDSRPVPSGEAGRGGGDRESPAAAASGGQRDAVGLALNWFPEAEHGGYYAALVHGFYEERGLGVRIIPGGPEAPVIPRVAKGTVEFGVCNADDVLFGRAQAAPVIAVMAPLQLSPRCILVHEKSGIQGFEDLKDITLAMSPRPAFSQYLRKRFPLTGVKIVPYQGSVTQFLMDDQFAQQGYVFSEPFVVRKKGGDPRCLMVSDAGFNPYTSVLVTNERLAAEKPQVVQKMVAACVRGWRHYLESAEETNQYIHRLNPEMDVDILAYGAEQLNPLVLDGVARKEGIGHMSLERWEQLRSQMVGIELIKADAVRASEAFRWVASADR
ncbi:MAG: ABC transporter substrate-binding protein [Planctomycetes bacterium]|nr:ABC transporter substrate-binding protein [Planctomycetota bacterium]